MTIPEIFNILQEKFPEAELTLEENNPDPIIRAKCEVIADISLLLRDDPDLSFDCLMCLSGVETVEEFQTVYHLYSMLHNHKVTLRVGGTKEDELVVPTVSHVWPTAEWHERESYDLFGISYKGHPDPRRILLPDDWIGYPLRKDYEPQKKWHKIPLTAIDYKEEENGDES